MKATRSLSLLLGLVMMLSLLVACGGTDDIEQHGGPRGEDGAWDAVDFKGQEVNFCISVNKYDECTFPAADIYTRGPDQAGSNEVAKEVLARNAAAEADLNVTINYSEKDLPYNKILEDIRGIVQTSAKNSPDIYNNDIYGLARAMVDGLLWNVLDPGEGITNYFDFEVEGWYTEFMKGCTFDQTKMYLFAGDYFIDMIRMAWVVYVNNELFVNNLNKMPVWCADGLDTFYEYVDAGLWDLDAMGDIAGRVFVEGAGGKAGVTEPEDATVGLAINAVTNWIVSASSEVTLYYQDKDDNYAPKVMQTIDTYQKVSDKYVSMIGKQGVYEDAVVVESTNRFLKGNFLFAFSRLGEMESAGLRDFAMAKSLVPVPKWNYYEQDDYHTVVHDQAEIGCILNTAKAYAAASALMQYLNEESDKVVEAYYEKGLKYKYNDDENARIMMDLVRDTTDSPFSWQIGVLCQQLYTGSGSLKGLYIKDNATIASTFASEKDAYNDCMAKMLAKFAELD